jgi:hypothetical protein
VIYKIDRISSVVTFLCPTSKGVYLVDVNVLEVMPCSNNNNNDYDDDDDDDAHISKVR